MPRGIGSGTILASPMRRRSHRQRVSRDRLLRLIRSRSRPGGACAAIGKKAYKTLRTSWHLSDAYPAPRSKELEIDWISRGCRRKEVIDMNRRIVSSTVDSSRIPARLPIRTEDLTHGQFARISGGGIRWRDILRDLFGIDLGTNPPEADASRPLL